MCAGPFLRRLQEIHYIYIHTIRRVFMYYYYYCVVYLHEILLLDDNVNQSAIVYCTPTLTNISDINQRTTRRNPTNPSDLTKPRHHTTQKQENIRDVYCCIALWLLRSFAVYAYRLAAQNIARMCQPAYSRFKSDNSTTTDCLSVPYFSMWSLYRRIRIKHRRPLAKRIFLISTVLSFAATYYLLLLR